jgi:hypothetical protein
LPSCCWPTRILGAEATQSGDGWRVELSDGTVLGTRALAHPHVAEQPFTRSLFGVLLPEGSASIHFRTRTSQTGWDGETLPLLLP